MADEGLQREVEKILGGHAHILHGPLEVLELLVKMPAWLPHRRATSIEAPRLRNLRAILREVLILRTLIRRLEGRPRTLIRRLEGRLGPETGILRSTFCKYAGHARKDCQKARIRKRL